MKQPQHITFTGAKTTPTHVAHWAQVLTQLHARIATRFVPTRTASSCSGVPARQARVAVSAKMAGT